MSQLFVRFFFWPYWTLRFVCFDDLRKNKKFRIKNQWNTWRTPFNTNHRFPQLLFHGRYRSSIAYFRMFHYFFFFKNLSKFLISEKVSNRYLAVFHDPNRTAGYGPIARRHARCILRLSNALPRTKVDCPLTAITKRTVQHSSLNDRKHIFRFGFTTKFHLTFRRRTSRRFTRFFSPKFFKTT